MIIKDEEQMRTHKRVRNCNERVTICIGMSVGDRCAMGASRVARLTMIKYKLGGVRDLPDPSPSSLLIPVVDVGAGNCHPILEVLTSTGFCLLFAGAIPDDVRDSNRRRLARDFVERSVMMPDRDPETADAVRDQEGRCHGWQIDVCVAIIP
jgi:hypothetical protein